MAIMPQSSPCAPALGVMATAGMPVSSESQCDSSPISAMAPGHRGERLQRVQVAEAGQARHLLVEARVVLHGARAEREDAGVDAVVLLAEPHVVAHGLGLGQARQADGRGALEVTEARRHGRRLLQVDAGGIGAADLEDQRLLDGEAAVAAEGGRAQHAGTSGQP